MNKYVRQILLTTVAIIAFSVCVPHKAEAKDYYNNQLVGTLKKNTWTTSKGTTRVYSGSNTTHKYNLYKISVPANAYVKIDTKMETGLYLFDEFAKKRLPNFILESYSGSTYKALPKGTYYICTRDKTKIRYNTYKAAASANYCYSRAQNLASGKKAIFTDRDGYNRWYKIKLTKRKAITFYFFNLSGSSTQFNDWALYDVNGTKLECPSSYSYNESVIGTAKSPILVKGTYYLFIRDPHEAHDNLYDTKYGLWDVKSFYWK